jgi:hypothetical protein
VIPAPAARPRLCAASGTSANTAIIAKIATINLDDLVGPPLIFHEPKCALGFELSITYRDIAARMNLNAALASVHRSEIAVRARVHKRISSGITFFPLDYRQLSRK